MTQKEARAYTEDLINWKVTEATDLTRVLTLTDSGTKYARVQVLHKHWSEGRDPYWTDIWTGKMDGDLFDEQITIPRIAEKIWRASK